MIAVFLLSGFGLQARGEPGPYEFPAPASGPILDIATAPIIVVGIAGDSQSQYFKDEGLVRTFTKFQVQSVERGEIAPGSEITISALGGSTPELTQLSEHQPIFTKSQKSRLFLTRNEKVEGVYRVFGLDQGKQDEPGSATSKGFTAAAECGQPFCLNGVSWDFERLPAGYKVNHNTNDESGEENAVIAGFNTWERSDSRMDFHYRGETLAASVQQDGTSIVFWHTVQGENCGATNWLACWTPFFDGGGYVEFDIDFNDAYKWEIGPEANEYDIESVALHEAGHALGLDHTTVSTQMMYASIGDDEEQRSLGTGDIAGVTTLYPANIWYLRNSNSSGSPDVTPFAFGSATDTPLSGDWDGDGDDTPGLFRAPNQWFLDNAFDGVADVSFTYGTLGDTPVVGDWDGDGDTTPGVKRGNIWHLSNDSDDPVVADISLTWGSSSDVFFGGDWNGTGGDSPGIFRPSTREWFLNNNFDQDVTDSGEQSFTYGSSGDLPAVGNWDGSNGCASPNFCHDTPGLWRSTQIEPNIWHLNNGFDGVGDISFGYGRRGNKLAGDWNNNNVDTIGVR